VTDLVAVVAAYQQRYGAIRSQVLARVDALWRQHGGLSESDADAWLAAVLPVVDGAQHATTGLVGGYAATVLRLAGDRGAAPSLDAAAAAATRGVDPAEVYMRPVITARAEVSRGATYHEAVEVARTRAGVTAQTDVALAQRDSMAQVEHQSSRIVGWRRVLTGASCAFCATASTQRYGGPNLMPIHDRCDCGVAPIIGSSDPGHVINRPLLDNLKSAAKEAKGTSSGYWSNRHASVDEDGNVTLTQPAVKQHGELGPVLVDPEHHFDGPAVAA
jgi:hypothetical protein